MRDEAGERVRTRVQVYRVDPVETEATRERARARKTSPENRELARVRTLLYELRPDCPDPCYPPARELPTGPVVRIRDPMANWGGIPKGYGAMGWDADNGAGNVAAWAVVERIAALDADARAVCTWLRAHARLVDDNLRGLYVDLGWAFRDAAQAELWARDLTARRDGAHHAGRTLVLATVRAWGLPES